MDVPASRQDSRCGVMFRFTPLYIIFLALLAAMACTFGTAEKEKIVASVNGAPIAAAELRKEVAGYGKNNPIMRHTVEDQLKVMIEQRLLIQEAVKLGLNEDPKFAATIKTYWEQTLRRAPTSSLRSFCRPSASSSSPVSPASLPWS